MCGRARCTIRPDGIPRACHLNGRPVRSVNLDRYRPSYNVSPGSNLPVIRREDGSDGQGAVIECMKWGLIPSFTKKTEKPDHYRMFNARSESVREKASFRRLVPNNRCLVTIEGIIFEKPFTVEWQCCSGELPLKQEIVMVMVIGDSSDTIEWASLDADFWTLQRLSDFYEWKKEGSKKQPYYIHFKDDRPLVLAALYDSWKNSEGEIIYTFTILTTSSSSSLDWLHDRMPVILGDKVSIDAWLMSSSSSKFDTLLKPYEEPDLVWYPVTPAMGKPAIDGPECIKEIQLKNSEQKSISKFFSKKGIDNEKDLKPQDRSTYKEPIKTIEEVKEEPRTLEGTEHSSTTHLKTENEDPENQSSTEHPYLIERGDEDSKLTVSTLSCEGAANIQTKRDYEEFSAGSKPSIDETNKLHGSPARKRGTNKGAADKQQPTLFSYFGKG